MSDTPRPADLLREAVALSLNLPPDHEKVVKVTIILLNELRPECLPALVDYRAGSIEVFVDRGKWVSAMVREKIK